MATNESSAEQHNFDELKRDLGTLQADVARLMHTILGDKENSIAEAARSGKRAIEHAEAGIRHRPFIAILLAFMIGLVFGRVVKGR